jgi:hypothetical protein
MTPDFQAAASRLEGQWRNLCPENHRFFGRNDTIFLGLRSGFGKIFSGIYARETEGLPG